MLWKLFKITLWLLLLTLLSFAGLLLFSTLTDYRPDPGSEAPLEAEGSVIPGAAPGDTLRILAWNIGYAGLGAEMDFFNDGGRRVRPPEEIATRYLEEVAAFLGSMKDSVDFALIQEIDRNSKRSYRVDQLRVIGDTLDGFMAHFALNYDVKFVPVPFRIPYKPYGKTYGGLASFSRYIPLSATRVQYPGSFGWPTRLYMLDRCALEQRFKLPSGKELLLVNTHNTAYDETGEIKKTEMEFMKKRYEAEHAKGTRIIIGGDWNQVPPGFDPKHFSATVPEGYTPHSIPPELLPAGFGVSYDPFVPSNRSVNIPYDPVRSYTTVIDYFVCSPGVEIIGIKTIDLQFRWSDHHPVLMTCVVR